MHKLESQLSRRVSHTLPKIFGTYMSVPRPGHEPKKTLTKPS